MLACSKQRQNGAGLGGSGSCQEPSLPVLRRCQAFDLGGTRNLGYLFATVRKLNEYIREKMKAQDTVLDVITRKQLIWYVHVERIDRAVWSCRENGPSGMVMSREWTERDYQKL